MSFLTNYRPNFCSECGEKIIRLRWRVWTSRRFCDKCAVRFRRAYWLQRAGAIVVLVLFGVLIGRGWRREPPALIVQRSVNVANSPGQNPSAARPPITTDETYICGARTKKGTPCSRRVHGPVRCWQHKGAKAMLPLEKLLLKD